MKLQKLILAAAAALISGSVMTACAQNTKNTGEDNKGSVTVLSEEQYKNTIEDYTDKEWEYEGKVPAVVDFYADWCGPCRRLSPIMDKLSNEYKGKVKFYKVNVDNARSLSAAYGIRSIPAVMFIPAEGEPQMNVGLMTEAEFKAKIKSILGVE